jgi:hypothetical protein
MIGPVAMSPQRRNVFRYAASVTYRGPNGEDRLEEFPVFAADSTTANDLALAYVVRVLKLSEFELRIVGS